MTTDRQYSSPKYVGAYHSCEQTPVILGFLLDPDPDQDISPGSRHDWMTQGSKFLDSSDLFLLYSRHHTAVLSLEYFPRDCCLGPELLKMIPPHSLGVASGSCLQCF